MNHKGDFVGIEGIVKSLSEKLSAGKREQMKEGEPRTLFNAGLIKAKSGDVAGAIANFDRAIELFPEYENASAKAQLGKHDDALADFEKALGISDTCEIAYYGRARERQRRGDFNGAMLDYQQLLKLNPKKYENDLGINMNLGTCLTKQGIYDVAIKFFSSAVNSSPNNPDPYMERANVRSCLADYKGAIEDYDKAIALRPPNVGAVTEKANIKDKMGDFYGALADYKYALGVVKAGSSGEYFIRFNMAVAKNKHNDVAGAIEDLAACLKIMPDDMKAKKFMETLVSKRDSGNVASKDYR